MKSEKDVRGKFYKPDGEFNLPVYLEPEITGFMKKLAVEKKLDSQTLAKFSPEFLDKILIIRS